MKKRWYMLFSLALTAILVGGANKSKIVSYACEKEEYLVVNENKDVNVKEISRMQADSLENNKDIMCVEPMTSVSGSAILSMDEIVSKYEDEWNIKMIKAENVNSYSANKIKVAILDSGIDYLDGINVVKRKNFIDKYEGMDVLYEDMSGHGTSIASVMAAKYSNDSSVKGINSNIQIYSGKILDEKNNAPMNRVIEGIYWAIEEDVDIISISFGTKNNSKALELAIKEAYDKGILVIAAAGNEHSDIIEYPAAYKEVLSVGGVNSKGQVSEYSSKSSKIDIYAPGEQVKTIGAFEGEAIVSGTSIAVPHVVGVASVIWQKDKTKTNDFVKSLIIDSACKNTRMQNVGIVDLEYAMKLYDGYILEKDVTKTGMMVENTTDLYVDDSVNYVTGSWCGKEHKETVTSAAGKKFGIADIALLKWGAVYSDKSTNLKGMTTNPYFHGYNKKKDYKTTKTDYNYLAGYIYLTRCALAGEINQNKSDLLNTSGDILEMDEKLKLINFGGKESFEGDWFNRTVLLGRANNKKNRSLLLWGMAMHAAADVYAHSSYTNINGKWIYISHESTEIKEADNKDFEPKRYASAKKIVSNVMQNCIAGREGSINDFILGNEYYDGSYKIRNLYDYASEIAVLNEQQTAILQSVTR